MTQAFDRQVAVPAVTNVQELWAALKQFNGIDLADMNQALQQLAKDNNSDHVGVGIKTVLTMAESSTMVQDSPAAWFAEQMSQAIITNNPRMVD